MDENKIYEYVLQLGQALKCSLINHNIDPDN